MSRGPIEVLLLTYPRGVDPGHLVAELRGPVESGTLRVVDLVLVERAEDGSLELHDVEHERGQEVAQALLGFDPHTLLNDADVEVLAAAVGEDEQGAVLVVEHLWARTVTAGLRRLGAEMALHVRVTPDEAEAAFAASDG